MLTLTMCSIIIHGNKSTIFVFQSIYYMNTVSLDLIGQNAKNVKWIQIFVFTVVLRYLAFLAIHWQVGKMLGWTMSLSINHRIFHISYIFSNKSELLGGYQCNTAFPCVWFAVSRHGCDGWCVRGMRASLFCSGGEEWMWLYPDSWCTHLCGRPAVTIATHVRRSPQTANRSPLSGRDMQPSERITFITASVKCALSNLSTPLTHNKGTNTGK